MPKKHQPAYSSIKPNYVHPSLQSSRAPSADPPRAPTVNERIQQLRREQTPRATAQRRDEVTEVVSRRTVPPQLRRILHMAEVDAPKPKPGIRSRTPLRPGQRPPPGPATPRSWLGRSIYSPERTKIREGSDGTGINRLCKLAKVHGQDFKRLPPQHSLVHHALRTFAMHWEELVEYEQHYLPSLPIPLKEAMLSYLSLHGDRGCVDFKSFKILFRNDENGRSDSETDDVHFLDLTGLLNERFTLKDLAKSFQRSWPSTTTSGMANLALSESNAKEMIQTEVVDSWEDEEEAVATPVLSADLIVPAFRNLSRLSLAHPGAAASWTDLLAISPHLKRLTHLSLAYWPRPSTTPNAATTSMVAQHTTISLGGTHFYSDLDDDWHEAANILRRLSLNTYCLKWLDLEGCTWIKALTWDYSINGSNAIMASTDQWIQPSSSPAPDWNGAWAQIEYVGLFQGWLPRDASGLRSMPAGVVAMSFMSWLREHDEDEDEDSDGEGCVFRSVNDSLAISWLNQEKIAYGVGSAIQLARNRSKGKHCTIDHGWGR